MIRKIVKNEFKNDPWSQCILFLFMTLSVTLAVSVSLMLVQLFSSISTMYERANPPHFLQMHKGELQQADLDSFNRSYPGIEHWQSVPMINVYGEELLINGEDGRAFSLEACRLDISLVKQNQDYDVLLDERRQPLKVRTGEIGVPVILLEQYDIQIGDRLILQSGEKGKSFLVADYVYDGQMNSTLCSSTRFLVSDEDFAELHGTVGETEYLIEAYFTDRSMGSAYQTAYEQSERNLPKDGQAVTYTMLFLLSAMTDLMMAMVFLLVGMVLIVIALICLRYCLLTRLEQEKQEIGTMKAIGIPARGIRNLYLLQIRTLMTAGCTVGYLLSLLTVTALTGRMSRTFGKQTIAFSGYISGVVVCILLYEIVVLSAKKILGRLRRVTVVDLLVTAKGFAKEKRIRSGLYGIKGLRKALPVNFLMGLHEVRQGYGFVFGLLCLITVLVFVPGRILTTLEHESFVTCMGSPLCDGLLEVEQGEGLEERKEAAEELLRAEQRRGVITEYRVFRRVRLQAESGAGELAGIHIDTGEGAGDGVQYLNGAAPGDAKHIALSCLMAEELEKEVNDSLTILADKKALELTVSGIYQDVTSGGRTAKAVCEFPETAAEKYSYMIELAPSVEKEQVLTSFRTQLGSRYSMENMEDFLAQTFGGITSGIRQSAGAAFVMGAGLIIMILFLFLKFRITRLAAALMGKRAMGIPFTAICMQELYPVLLAGAAGIAAGMICVGSLGDTLVSMMMELAGLGLKRIEFAPASLWQCMGIPFVFLLLLVIVTMLCCRQIRKLNREDYVSE